jgi:hypothetical protein
MTDRPRGRVKIDLRCGRLSSFEVTLDEELLHSVLGGHGWPETEKAPRGDREAASPLKLAAEGPPVMVAARTASQGRTR